MTDRFAEVRELEGEIAAKITECYRAPWRLLRNRRLRREARQLGVLLRAAIGRAAR